MYCEDYAMIKDQEIDQLNNKITELEALLNSYAAEALEDVSHWGRYASEYLSDKFNLAGDILKWSQRAEGL